MPIERASRASSFDEEADDFLIMTHLQKYAAAKYRVSRDRQTIDSNQSKVRGCAQWPRSRLYPEKSAASMYVWFAPRRS
jgi:hypothetical protein